MGGLDYLLGRRLQLSAEQRRADSDLQLRWVRLAELLLEEARRGRLVGQLCLPLGPLEGLQPGRYQRLPEQPEQEQERGRQEQQRQEEV